MAKAGVARRGAHTGSTQRVARGAQAAVFAATAVGGVAATARPADANHPAGCVTQDFAGDPWDANCWVGYSYDTNGGFVNGVQTALQAMLLYPGCVDGAFGSQTAGAVEDFQAGFDPDPDGIVGGQTWTRLWDTYRHVHTSQTDFYEYGSFGPWNTDWRHRREDVDAFETWTRSGSCSAGGADWVKMAV
jgi:outer membrane cobalamin receptor